ncbi:MAG TPA: hypothetical protein VGB70_11150 [Allosphingosinicella sp.]
MTKLFTALFATALATAAHAAPDDIAPPLKRKAIAPATAKAAEPAQQPARAGKERDYQAALSATAAQGGDDAALDGSLIRVMSSLLAAGRCGEAAGLASRDGRKALAARAQQLCQ